jgi:hypothetical protein
VKQKDRKKDSNEMTKPVPHRRSQGPCILLGNHLPTMKRST